MNRKERNPNKFIDRIVRFALNVIVWTLAIFFWLSSAKILRWPKRKLFEIYSKLHYGAANKAIRMMAAMFVAVILLISATLGRLSMGGK